MDDSRRWLTAAEQTAWVDFVLMQLQLLAHLDQTLDRFDLSFHDFGVLARLTDTVDGQARLSELAQMSGFERSRMSHHVNRMEARGLVERVKCEADRRGAFVRITDIGRSAIVTAAPTHAADVVRHVFDRLNADDVIALARIARSILDGLAVPR